MVCEDFKVGAGGLSRNRVEPLRAPRAKRVSSPGKWGCGCRSRRFPTPTRFLSAFYFPVLLLLLLIGLIFRGIAFAFRYRSERRRYVWDRGFFLGSTIVAFGQGNAMMRGIPVTNGQYAGSAFSWPHPFAILTGIWLVLGYALLGAAARAIAIQSPHVLDLEAVRHGDAWPVEDDERTGISVLALRWSIKPPK
jgi:hypothetical protein